MKHFLTFLSSVLLPLACVGAPSYTTYFNNTHTYTNATVAGTSTANAMVATNGITGATVTATKAFQSYQGTLTHAGSMALDFDATTTVNQISLTGAVTFTTSNLATNRNYRLLIKNVQATNCTPTFPSWKFLGGAPSTITAGQWGMLSLEAWGTTDASVVAAYSESQ